MKVTELTLVHYRNIENTVFHPGDGVNVIYGDNAQGKTNLLESLWMFSGAKSFRGSKDSEQIGFGFESAKLSLDFFAQGRQQNAEIFLRADKEITLNQIPVPSPGALAGSFLCVVFSPSHLSLVKDGPGQRRRFIDTAVGQLRPSFIALLADYKKTLLQRNSLLRDIKYHSSLYDTLDIWDERLVTLGTEVVRYRTDFIDRLTPKAMSVYRGISGDREELSLCYQSSGGQNAEEFLQKLNHDRGQDIKFGTTATGPHRDDLAIFLDRIHARNFASQGQQRSCVLSLKLAEADLIGDSSGEFPVILLDDVMSELDSTRQDYILGKVTGHQVFITCCDPAYFKRSPGISVFYMKDGELSPSMGSELKIVSASGT